MGHNHSQNKEPEIKEESKEPEKPVESKKKKHMKIDKNAKTETLKQTWKPPAYSVLTFFLNILDRLFFAPMQCAEPCIGDCFRLPIDFDDHHKVDKEVNGDEETENTGTGTCLSLKLQGRFLAYFEARKKKRRKANEKRRKKRKEMTPLWDKGTYHFMERLYHIVARDTQDETFSLKHFVAACARVGYRVTARAARDRFWCADANKDGFLNIDEFFELAYYFDPPKKNKLNGLALYCALSATAEKFIKDLDGEQRLMFGLV